MTLKEKLTAFWTIVVKEIRRFTRIWLQTMLPPAITTGLYFAIFGQLIGSRIGSMDGVSYIQFIIPGLIMMTMITNSYANVVSSFYLAKFSRSIEEMQVSPLPNYIILLGYLCGGITRGLMVGVIVIFVSMFFAKINIHNIWVIISIAALTTTLFSLAGFINAVFAQSFDDISIIPVFVLTPLTYLGGIFYSVSLLSPFWQKVSLLNPILYMVNAFRYGMLGKSDIPLALSYSIIIVFIVTLFLLSLYLLRKGIGIRT